MIVDLNGLLIFLKPLILCNILICQHITVVIYLIIKSREKTGYPILYIRFYLYVNIEHFMSNIKHSMFQRSHTDRKNINITVIMYLCY